MPEAFNDLVSSISIDNWKVILLFSAIGLISPRMLFAILTIFAAMVIFS